MKIGFFGASFDPIHYGHLIMASFICDQLKLDKIYFSPSEKPPHKLNKKVTDTSLRNKMVELAIKDDNRFVLTKLEQGENKPSYSVESMKKLKTILPDDDIFFILGKDSLETFHKWYKIDELKKLVKIVVVDRVTEENKNINELVDFYKKKEFEIFLVSMPLIEISSSDIRERKRQGKSIKYLTNSDVVEFINREGIYV